MTLFPDAEYLIVSSRLIPDLDGGYTLATLAPGAPHGRGGHPRRSRAAAAHCRSGHAPVTTRATARRSRGGTSSSTPGACAICSTRPAIRAAAPRRGCARRRIPVSRIRRSSTGRSRHRKPGPILALPVIAGDPDWHISTAPVVVHAPSGSPAGVIDGFGALYRAWLAHVVTELRGEDGDRPVVVICESRQLGELLVGWDDAGRAARARDPHRPPRAAL